MAHLAEGFDADRVALTWGERAGVGADAMTVAVTVGSVGGKGYDAVVWLHLPSS